MLLFSAGLWFAAAPCVFGAASLAGGAPFYVVALYFLVQLRPSPLYADFGGLLFYTLPPCCLSPFEFSGNFHATARRSAAVIYAEILPPPPGVGLPIKKDSPPGCFSIIGKAPARLKRGRGALAETFKDYGVLEISPVLQ